MMGWRSALRRLYGIAAKELLQLRRDRLTLAMVVGLPLLQMVLFGYAINFDVRQLPAGVVDMARTHASRALIAELTATQVLHVVATPHSPAELAALMQQGQIKVGLYIPADFERRLLRHEPPLAQLLVDGSEPTLENLANGIAQLPINNRSAINAFTVQQLAVRTEYNPEKRSPVQIVPGLIGVILSLTMVMFTAIAIVRERERGNLELLIATPVTSLELLAGKLLPYVGIGLIQVSLVLLVGRWWFDVPVNGRWLDVYLAALLFIAATLTLGLVISTLVRTQAQAMQASLFLLLPSILLSGFVFPFSGMPRFAQWLAQLLPLTHFIVMVRGIVLRGAPLAALWLPAAKLGVFLLLTLSIAVARFRKRLD